MTEAKDRLLRLNEVLAKVNVGKSTLYEMIAAGKFPRAAHLGGNVVRWSENAVDAWIAERVAESADRRAS